MKSAESDQVERLGGIFAPHIGAVRRFVEMIDAGAAIDFLDYSDLPYVVDKLNPNEKILFNRDPIVGSRILLHASKSIRTAQDLYDASTLHNGNGDAFRHFYWNFCMASDANVGGVWAERWGNAHEEGGVAQPAVERLMDLHNNLRGRQTAAAGNADDPKALRSEVRNGSCRICPNGTLVKSDRTGEK